MKTKNLSRAEWEVLCQRVYERDLAEAWLASDQPGAWEVFKLYPQRACVASFLDRVVAGPCHGRITFDHVKFVLVMQRKAPDDEQHLVSVCEWHHGTNRTGGGWSTSHRAREIVRGYLRRLYPELPAVLA